MRALWPAWVAFAIGAVLVGFPTIGIPDAFAPENQKLTFFLLFWGLVAIGFGAWRVMKYRDAVRYAAMVQGR